MGSLEEGRLDFRSSFRGRNVLITGHTGFKGSWLTLWLARLGARVTGYALAPPTQPSNFETSRVRHCLQHHVTGDVRDGQQLRRAVCEADPDVIFHLAAQPLVRTSYRDPQETYATNIMGTVNLLEAVRLRGRPCVVLVITTDKCYADSGQVWGYRECDPLGGHDPYSTSKAASELIVASYRDSYFPPRALARHGVQLASTRAGNVIGGGDWATDRLVVDILKCLAADRPIALRNPHATRPWQHVLEPLGGYCQLAGAMLDDPAPRWSSAWNFGPLPGRDCTVRELTEALIRAWGVGSWVDCSDPAQPHETDRLRLCIDKAMTQLQWTPGWSFQETVRRTVTWYRAFHDVADRDMSVWCRADIAAYEETLLGQSADVPSVPISAARYPAPLRHKESRKAG